MYRPRSHNLLLMSALGAALASVGGSIASAADRVEQAAVMGALKCTHAITEQVCEFDTIDQLHNFLAEVADSHHWKMPDYLMVGEPASALIPQPLETKDYSDGTSATGTALPDLSPAQQYVQTDAADTPAPAGELNPPASTEPTPQWIADAQPPAADTSLVDSTGPATTTDTAATGDTPATGE